MSIYWLFTREQALEAIDDYIAELPDEEADRVRSTVFDFLGSEPVSRRHMIYEGKQQAVSLGGRRVLDFQGGQEGAGG